MKQKYILFIVALFCFCMAQAQQLSQYEYWFDGNYSVRRAVSIGGSSATILELDAGGLSDGFHRWYLRVKNTDGSYSGVTSGSFFKHPVGAQMKLEYWYNDHFDSRKVLSPAEAENTELLVRDMPWGLNRISFRLAGGTVYQSDYVLKTQSGASNKLEYWFDDDMTNTHTISSNIYASKFSIAGDIDVSDLSEGIHRIYYRLASGIREHNPVYSDFFFKGHRQDDDTYTVTHARYWIDNDKAEGVVQQLDNPRSLYSYSAIADLNAIAAGNHTLNLQFMNSAGMWSAIEAVEFQKVKYEQGSITLNASLTENNQIKLVWNAIPDIGYYKISINGQYYGYDNWYRSNDNTSMETTLTHLKAGTHTFQIHAFTSNNSTFSSVVKKSNTVSLYMPDKSVETGLLVAQVGDENMNPVEDVTFTNIDNHKITDTHISSTGIYEKAAFYGTEGSISAKKTGWLIEPRNKPGVNSHPYKINEQTPNFTVYFTATPLSADAVTGSAELEMASTITGMVDEDGFLSAAPFARVTIKNISGHEWAGWIYLTVNNPTQKQTDDYYNSIGNFPRVWVELDKNKETTIHMDFSVAFKNQLEGAAYSVVTLKSLRKIGDTAMGTKLVAAIPNKSYFNPMAVIPGGGGISNGQYWDAEVINALMGEVLTNMKSANSFFKDMSTAYEELKSDVTFLATGWNTKDKITKGMFSDLAIIFKNLNEEMRIKIGAAETLEEQIERCKLAVDGWDTMMQFLNGSHYTQQTGYFKPKRFFDICTYFSKSAPKPLSSVFDTYFKVGAAYADKIDEYGNFLFDNYQLPTLGHTEDPRQYLKIKAINKSGNAFTSEEIAKEIKSVVIEACTSNSMNSCVQPSRLIKYKKADVQSDKFAYTLKMENPIDYLTILSAQLKIIWKNGRISWVPVTSKFVKFDNETIIVEFKSEYKMAEHMATKITLN